MPPPLPTPSYIVSYCLPPTQSYSILTTSYIGRGSSVGGGRMCPLHVLPPPTSYRDRVGCGSIG